MKLNRFQQQSILGVVGILAILLAGCTVTNLASVTLSGAEQNPPVTTFATGTATISVLEDKTVKGRVTTDRLAGTAAHIHIGARGTNGPVAVGLVKAAGYDNVWEVPAGAKLTDAQYDAYKAGNLYVNVHSAANKGGEIRAQLK
jgi:xanthine/uracil/vitamin C permease (AzgA family)